METPFMVNVLRFDKEEVLDKILHTFWRKGYAATSLDDLVAATGVKRQSLYNTFGNKDDMYLLSYQSYVQNVERVIQKAVEQDPNDLKTTVRNVLEACATIASDPKSPYGCFMTNSCVEFGERNDPAIRDLLCQNYKALEQLLFDILKRGREQGNLAKDRDPRSIAQFLVASISAFAVMYRYNKNKSYARNVISEILHVLD